MTRSSGGAMSSLARLPLQNRRDHARRAFAFERALAREHFVQHAAEAEQIAARVGFLALQLLRRHVLQGADDLPLVRERLASRGIALLETNRLLRQSEIEQLDALLGDQDVGRLQIAMRDALLGAPRPERPESAPRIRPSFRAAEGPCSGAPSTYSITR